MEGTMSEATDALKAKANAYRSAAQQAAVYRRSAEDTKRDLKQIERKLFLTGTDDGTIAGKNAETRQAEAEAMYRSNGAWASTEEVLRLAVERDDDARVTLQLAEMDLKVAVVLVNAEIASSGAVQLLTRVDLPIT
jgi:hypothetical protein